jgi:hypothetical protein
LTSRFKIYVVRSIFVYNTKASKTKFAKEHNKQKKRESFLAP